MVKTCSNLVITANFLVSKCFKIVLILNFRHIGLGKHYRARSMEQSDQGQHCSPFYMHLLDKFLYGKTSLSEVKGDSVP